MGLVDKLFGSYSAKELKRIRPQVDAVLALEDHYRQMDNKTLQGETARADALPALGDAVAEAGLDGRLLQQEHGVTPGSGGQGTWLLRWEWGQRMLPDLRPLPTMPAGASSSASAATEDMP